MCQNLWGRLFKKYFWVNLPLILRQQYRIYVRRSRSQTYGKRKKALLILCPEDSLQYYRTLLAFNKNLVKYTIIIGFLFEFLLTKISKKGWDFICYWQLIWYQLWNWDQLHSPKANCLIEYSIFPYFECFTKLSISCSDWKKNLKIKNCD